MTINTVGVCGAGTMGSGIAQVAAQAGFATILYEVNETVLSNAKKNILKNLEQLAGKGKIRSDEANLIFQRIYFTNELKDCMADIFIEAIVEKPEIKIALFNQLAILNKPGCILASNTSSLSVTDIAEKVHSPARVIGMHFFNPAPVMKLVEVVNTIYNDETITKAVVELARRMGKIPVVCKDSPGFIVNRVARPYYIEALRLLEEGITTIEQADTLLEACGFKMGPFKLMDLIGNDVNYAVSCSVYEQLGKPERLRPSPIQEEKVATGQLGRKTKKGYYPYD